MDKIEQAVTCFKNGCLCSQSVLTTFAPEFGLPVEVAMKIASPFGSGMARNGEICGAVTGSLMVIGLAFGNKTREDQAAKEETYRQANEFISRFQKQHGSLKCIDLLGYPINTPEKLQLARDKGVFERICPNLVGDAIQILSDLLMGAP